MGYYKNVGPCRKLLTMAMAEYLIQLGETMMTSMSTFGKFLTSLSAELINFLLCWLTCLIFLGRFNPSSLVGRGEPVHLFFKNLDLEQRFVLEVIVVVLVVLFFGEMTII